MNEHVTPGRYRHYKGGEYEVFGEAVHSETLERMVLYRSLADANKTWVRPRHMFFETVVVDGETMQRFTPM